MELKRHMSDRYFDWTMDCFKHMIFEITPKFIEELVIKMNKKKKKKCDTIYKISWQITRFSRGSELADLRMEILIMGILTNIVQIQTI